MIVEDDKALSNGIALALQSSEMDVLSFHSIQSAKSSYQILTLIC